jgi:A/G-specific adenine glycosylase
VVCGAGHDEQQIGEPVHVADDLWFHGLSSESDDAPFGAPADRARHVQRGAGPGTAGKDEAPQRRQLTIQQIYPSLEPADILVRHGGLGDALCDLPGRIGKSRTEAEQIALNPLEHLDQLGVGRRLGAHEPKPCIQFVHVTIRGDPGVGLEDPTAAKEGGLAAIARPRVDFHVLIMAVEKQARGRKNAARQRRPAGRATSPGAPVVPEPAQRRLFRRRLLEWYRRNGRDLPWRLTRDPYSILVSEVMLQQTQVDRVLPKYQEWLEKYPTLQALASAPEADVSETWRPLGYNVRPRRLHAIARESVERYGGELPGDEATLRSFKGIGEYTAGAVLSFAFGQRAAILDTNVARVLYRVFVGSGDPKAHAMRRHLWSVSRTVLPRRHVFDFNQALMDFGATLCTARKPKCSGCPMRRACLYGPVIAADGSPPA